MGLFPRMTPGVACLGNTICFYTRCSQPFEILEFRNTDYSSISREKGRWTEVTSRISEYASSFEASIEVLRMLRAELIIAQRDYAVLQKRSRRFLLHAVQKLRRKMGL